MSDYEKALNLKLHICVIFLQNKILKITVWNTQLEALFCDDALYKLTFTLHYIKCHPTQYNLLQQC